MRPNGKQCGGGHVARGTVFSGEQRIGDENKGGSGRGGTSDRATIIQVEGG